MTPVCVYIDGFNLYHALLKFRDPQVKWLDLRLLALRLIAPKSETISKIYYFSAYADWLPGPRGRHEQYVAALKARGIECVMGHFKNKDRWCKHCRRMSVGHEEKETDVSIGITLLNDAYKGAYEKAFLVTRDSDLMPAVKMVRQEFPAKHIVAVAPPMMGHSNDLIGLSNSKMKISPRVVRDCLFPQRVYNPNATLAAVRPTDYD